MGAASSTDVYFGAFARALIPVNTGGDSPSKHGFLQHFPALSRWFGPFGQKARI